MDLCKVGCYKAIRQDERFARIVFEASGTSTTPLCDPCFLGQIRDSRAAVGPHQPPVESFLATCPVNAHLQAKFVHNRHRRRAGGEPHAPLWMLTAEHIAAPLTSARRYNAAAAGSHRE
jgi:hypothetical protein